MSKNHHGGPAPVPPGNQSHIGPPTAPGDEGQPGKNDADGGAPFQDQDAKRRLGNFETAGEHSRQQPGRLNDGDVHSR